MLDRTESWVLGVTSGHLLEFATAEAGPVTAQRWRKQRVEVWPWNWRAGPQEIRCFRPRDSPQLRPGYSLCGGLGDKQDELDTETGWQSPMRHCTWGPRSHHKWGHVGHCIEVWATDNGDFVLKPEGWAHRDPVLMDQGSATTEARQVTVQRHQRWREGTQCCSWRAELWGIWCPEHWGLSLLRPDRANAQRLRWQAAETRHQNQQAVPWGTNAMGLTLQDCKDRSGTAQRQEWQTEGTW